MTDDRIDAASSHIVAAAGYTPPSDDGSDRLLPFMIRHIRVGACNETIFEPMKEVLGLDFKRNPALDGDDDDNADPFAGVIATRGGTMFGIACFGRGDLRAPNHEWEDNLLRYLGRVSTGSEPVRLEAPAMFDTLQSAALRHDGYSPEGVQALVRVVGQALLEAGPRRHVLIPRGRSWEGFQIVLGRGVHVGETGLVIAQSMPETVAAAIAGRRADTVVDHPVLRDFVVETASPRRTDTILTLAPMDRAKLV